MNGNSYANHNHLQQHLLFPLALKVPLDLENPEILKIASLYEFTRFKVKWLDTNGNWLRCNNKKWFSKKFLGRIITPSVRFIRRCLFIIFQQLSWRKGVDNLPENCIVACPNFPLSLKVGHYTPSFRWWYELSWSHFWSLTDFSSDCQNVSHKQNSFPDPY